MLGKMLKYDLKWVFSLISVFYILALIFAILARLTLLIEDSFVFSIIYKILSSTSVSMLVSSFINVITRSFVRFTRSVYGDESYLTHTLPVSKTCVFYSKVLTGIIVSLTSVIVALICLYLCYYSKELFEAIKLVLTSSSATLDVSVPTYILLFFLVVFLEFLYILFNGFAGIIIGHRFNQNKIGMSFLFGFIIYSIFQCIMLGGMFIYASLFSDQLLELFTSSSVSSMSAVKVIFITTCVLYGIFDVIILFIGKYQLDKGINVD